MTLENIQKEAIERFYHDFCSILKEGDVTSYSLIKENPLIIKDFISEQIKIAYQKGKEEGLLSKDK